MPHTPDPPQPTHFEKAEATSSEALNRILSETSIVIAVKDDIRVFDCISSVDEDIEIVLALNGTPLELREKLVKHPAGLVIAEIPDAGNLGTAYNAGIQATAKRYVLLMDSDCRFAPKAIRAMAEQVGHYPVIKGQVQYGIASGLISRLIARIREFDEGDYVSALSPPLIYDRMVADRIGGYHFNPLIHWCEDREFDFRLQMANIPVLYEERGIIFHDAQVGAQDLRSYWRYGIGEGIGQELGVFTTPAIPLVWRMVSDVKIVIECARKKGWLAGLYYFVTLWAFHAGTAWHLLADPYKVRSKYPPWARRVRMLSSIPQHCTSLTEDQKCALRNQHMRAGCPIEATEAFQRLLAEIQMGHQATYSEKWLRKDGLNSAE